MGALYREEVKCCRKGFFKGTIGLIAASLFLLMICFISDIMIFGEYFEGILLFAILIGGAINIRCKRKISKVYRYEIIDKEVIIEDVTKGKRNVKLSFNIKNIVDIKRCEENLNHKISKEYNFLCNGKTNNTKVCVFEKDDKLYKLVFEPSEFLITKIETIREKSNLKEALKSYNFKRGEFLA